MADVMHGGLTAVRTASFVTIVTNLYLLICISSFCLRHVNQRRAIVLELSFACWKPSIPYLTITGL